ncbi:hypothetical protein NDU88_003904 [Pleurodeles waltl]|uniref:Uncharacterized protein n=1 Tax=Pleurodeles waltl TaxID=8319 RepID=A0AAV7MWY4_PLEWA|nr:hypothetical protein NDU88_003904 [Pleurodeles waltl]
MHHPCLRAGSCCPIPLPTWAHQEADFVLRVESLKALVSWFFVLDHHNYACSLPVHICNMENLPPSILEEFVKHGHCIVQKELQNLLEFNYINDATVFLANLEELDEDEPSTEVNVRDLATELESLEEPAETNVPTCFDVMCLVVRCEGVRWY